MGMGRCTGGSVRRANEKFEAATNTGGRKHIHQRSEKYSDNRGCRHRRHPRTNDTGYDAGSAIHHRTTEQSGGTIDELPLFIARCENQSGTHQ